LIRDIDILLRRHEFNLHMPTHSLNGTQVNGLNSV
jgi:hypothetical protein